MKQRINDMRIIILIISIFPHVCLASTDIREQYINAVEDFSTCGLALMPWGNSKWRPDEAEKLYVEQAKINRDKMKSEIDEIFYTEANLQKLFVYLTNEFYRETSYLTRQIQTLASDDHDLIWRRLFDLEREARLVREKLASDFRLHAEIIKMCADE
tara:strand:+ start:213 stop:683 length:471 start_codon:yes stop_codon:yes gene_type:complete